MLIQINVTKGYADQQAKFLREKGYNLSKLVRNFIEDMAIKEGWEPTGDPVEYINPRADRMPKPQVKRVLRKV